MDIAAAASLAELALDLVVDLIAAAFLLVGGYLLADRARAAIIARGESDERVDPTLATFTGSLARYAILAFVVIAVLNLFGVETTSLVALVGAAGLAIGLALQGALSNLAAGVMLILFRPFKLGDYVDAAGHAGTVAEIGLFATKLTTPDNVLIILPNGAVWGAPITNFSANALRRVDLVFGVGYGADLRQAEASLRAVIAADARIKSEPAEPFVAVTNLGESAVDFTIRVWCEAGDYWGLRFDLLRGVKERLDADGVDIPFPTSRVFMSNVDA